MERIIVLDFGGQYAHLIANRIRRLGVYSEIQDNSYFPDDKDGINNIKGIILSGGPDSVYEKNSPKPHHDLFKLKIPILGLCYGHQIMAMKYGGQVRAGNTKEYGIANLKIKKSKLMAGLNEYEKVWMSHGDSVAELPQGFVATGQTKDCQFAAMENEEEKRYGLQFHPEVTHTPNGMKILSNFIFDICDCVKNWEPRDYTKRLVEDIKKTQGKVFMLVSGGVDSTVAFTLLNKALGQENVYGLFIDNGLLRKNERELVDGAIKRLGYTNFHTHDASELFIKNLKGIYDPEEKRNIIGDTFIDVQKQVLSKLKLDEKQWLLGQGTIYPDTIETKGTKNADLIKTHHNRVPIIQKMIEQGRVIEPLSQFYKDEVREIGLQLGLPKSIVFRHPFPGPGLGVRCLCSKEIGRETKDPKDPSLIILPIKSVGVQGDCRTYRNPGLIREKKSWDELEKISTDITNSNRNVNRVVLEIGTKIKNYNLKKAFITKERLDLLREADDIAMNTIQINGLMENIWQMPTIIAPIGEDGETIILRPVFSREAMTAEFAKIDMRIVEEIAQKIMTLPGVDAVLYDITNKPPGTIEWE